MLCALDERKVGREVLEPSSTALQTVAIPSQLPAQVVSMRARKNPVSLALVTPGFGNPVETQSSVTNANTARAYSPVDWRNYLCLLVRI